MVEQPVGCITIVQMVHAPTKNKLNGRHKNMDAVKQAEKLAKKAAKKEAEVLAIEQKFALKNAEFAKFLKQQDERNREVAKMWDGVKQTLIDAGYFDVIENENFRVSVSRVFGIKVVDVNELPKEFKKMVEVPETDKIKKHFELYNELPAGTADGSYYRLNKKVK